MFAMPGITIDALLFLSRVEVDKCKVLSRRANIFIEKHWMHILRHYVDGELVNEATTAYLYIGPHHWYLDPLNRSTSPKVDPVALERYRNMNRAEGWTAYADELDKVVRCVVKFAKRLSGFRALEGAEQMRLLKKHVFVMSIISVSQYYNSDTGLLAISDGRALPVNTLACSDEGDRQFVHDVLSGIHTLAGMHLTSTETALFASFTLLQNSTESQTHVEKIKTALIWQLRHRRSSSHAWVEYARMVNDVLPFFDFLSMEHIKCLSRLSSLGPPELQLPQLYKELFVAESH